MHRIERGLAAAGVVTAVLALSAFAAFGADEIKNAGGTTKMKDAPAPSVSQEQLSAAAKDALADPAVRQRLTDLGQEIPPPEQQGPDGLAAFHKAEIEKWWPIIKGANIKTE